MRTIFIIDDESAIRDYLQRLLKESGWDAITAGSGKEALEMLKFVAPHAILLDMNMPEMDGFSVARTLKQDPLYQSIPIIAATALSDLTYKERCLAAGCDDYLSKPFTLEELKIRLASVMQ